MKNKDEILNLICSRFPNDKDYLKELFEKNESFRSLCEDYFDCKRMLDEIINNNNKSRNLREEYQIILSEIEDELLEIITI